MITIDKLKKKMCIRDRNMSVEPKKWGVIYNPKAGTRKVKKRWKEIKEYMDSKGVDYDYVHLYPYMQIHFYSPRLRLFRV